MKRASNAIILLVCGVIGGWVGYWIGQPTVSTARLQASPDFIWWQEHSVRAAEGFRSHLGYLADEQLFSLWRFLLTIGMSTIFVCVAALVITRLPTWRAQKVLRIGVPVEATVVRVEETGEQRQARGSAGVERQLAVELHMRGEDGSAYRAQTTQFFDGSAQLALQPGVGLAVLYDPVNPDRVAIPEPVEATRRGGTPSEG